MRLMIKGQRMTTKEAIQAMLDGKKVKRKDFVEEVYAYEKGVFFNQYGMTIQGFGDNDDWEIYEAPKPKQTVVIEKWLLKMQGTNQYAIEEGSKEEMCTWGKNKIDAWQKVKLLDTYVVELP